MRLHALAVAGLLAAKVQYEKGKTDESRAALVWVVDNAVDDEYRALARLRLAGVLLDAKQYDEALKQLDPVVQGPFAALAADRRGDILQAQGKTAEAKAAYQQAWKRYEAGDEAQLLAMNAAIEDMDEHANACFKLRSCSRSTA